MLLILGGTKGIDATAACPPVRLVELHLQVEFAKPNNPDYLKNRKEGSYEDYQKYIDYPLGLGKFDFILIDGRARKYCLKNASEIIDEKGIVIVHDANREYYFDNTFIFSHELLLTDNRRNRGGIWVGSKSRPIEEVLQTDLHKRSWKINNMITQYLFQ